MSNPWITHVRKYAKDNGVTYACAIPDASKTYTKKQDTTKSITSKPTTPKPIEQKKEK